MTVHLPGDRVIHDGQPAIVLCGHPDGRLYIRPDYGAGDLLVAAETCTPVGIEPLRLRVAEEVGGRERQCNQPHAGAQEQDQ